MMPAEIVLIEDNPADVDLVKIALKESGISHTLRLFKNGNDAVQELCSPVAEPVQRPDAILMDLNTPPTDNFEVLRRLRESPHLSRVPINILTSSRARVDKQLALAQGVAVLEKPSQLADFLSSVGGAVREMLSGRS